MTWQSKIISYLQEARKACFKIFHYKHKLDNEYLTQFRAIVAIIKHVKGNIGDNIILVHTEMKRWGIAVDETVHIPGEQMYGSYIGAAIARTCTLVFIQGSDWNRYEKIHINLVKNLNHGQDIYPLNVA